MNRHSFFAAALLLASSTLALAQATKPAATPLPSDPGASAPPIRYHSVFQSPGKGVEMGTVDWKKANDEVGQFPRGHVDVLKWEAGQPKEASPQPADSALPKK